MRAAYAIILASIVLMIVAAPTMALRVDLLSTEPAPPNAGDYADITLRVQASNEEPVRNQVGIGLEENQFITPITSARQFSQIRPGDVVTVTIRAYISEDTPDGQIDVKSVVTYDGQRIVTNHDLIVSQADRRVELVIGEVETIPDVLLPDTDDNTMRVTLQNLGEKTAELVTAELIVDPAYAQPSSSFAFTDSLASIEGGEQGVLEFEMDIPEDVRDSTSIALDIRYRERRDIGDGFDVRTARIGLELPIDESPFLEVVHVEQLDSFSQGTQENRLRVTIQNTGVEEAEDVRVRLFPDISYPFIFERTSQYIGATLEPGDNSTFDIVLEVLDDAQVRDYALEIELESLVETTRFDQDDTLTISVTEGNSMSVRSVGMFIILAIIIVAGGIALWRRRNR